MQDDRKAVWSIPYVSVVLFPSLKQNFIAYRSSKVFWRPDCIFEIHQWWQPGFSRMYSNCCCSGSFKPEITEIGQSSHKMYSNKILNFQESTTSLNACTKKSLETYWRHHVVALATLSSGCAQYIYKKRNDNHTPHYLQHTLEKICLASLLRVFSSPKNLESHWTRLYIIADSLQDLYLTCLYTGTYNIPT